jgi:hypothetical protein
MMPFFPAPILPPTFVSGMSDTVFSIILILLTAILYLVLTVIPFWRDSGAKPDPETADDSFDQGEKK